MRLNIIVIFAVLLVGGALAFYLGYKFVYNKPHRNIEQAAPDFTVTANDLYTAFEANEEAAFAQYADKVLLVEGVVESVETPSDTMITVVLVAEDAMMGGVSVLLAPEYGSVDSYRQVAARLKSGEVVVLKGECTGFGLFGVELKNGYIQ